MRWTCVLLAVAALAGCGRRDSDPGPGGVTIGEARALDEAAEMLDARPPLASPAAEASTAPPAAER